MPTDADRPGRLQRIQFIDALRGVAALAVVLSHYNNQLSWPILEHGNLGVPIFFVLSGFVVTMSVGAAHIDLGFVGRFVLRRAVRLDPPYWATIAAVVAIGYALAGRVRFEGVTPEQVLAHMFYLQDILGFAPILPVFWTLCFEIQFYLALLVHLWLMQVIGLRPYHAVAATLVLSVIDRAHAITPAPFMGRFWFCFAVGALVYGAHKREISPVSVYLIIGGVLTYGALTGDGYALSSAVTAAAIALALELRRPNLLSGRVWQFLGRISYSLYLTHPVFGWLALRLAERFVPTPVAVLVGIAVAIGSAWAFYVVVERPAVRLSHQVPLRAQPRPLLEEVCPEQ